MATINTTGTITVTSGSAAIAGAGTNWAAAGIVAGTLYVDGAAYPIAAVNSDTSITLALPFAGSTASAKAYAISVDHAVLDQTTNNANRLADLLDGLTPLASYTTFSNGLMANIGAGEWRSGLGLGNVDNTSDLAKPVSTATQTALNAKASLGGAVDFNGNVTSQTQPLFHAVRSTGTDQTSPGIIQFGSAIINVGSHFNVSTGVFTAPVSGRYKFEGQIFCTLPTVGAAAYGQFHQNGIGVGALWHTTVSAATGNFAPAPAGITLFLTAGDTIDLRLLLALNAGTGVYRSYCSISGGLCV